MPTRYDTGTAAQSASVVTGTGTSWTSDMVGCDFIFCHGTKATITAVNSATSLTVSNSQTVSARQYRIHYHGLQVTNAGNTGMGVLTPTSRLDIDGALTVRGIAAPAASPANQGRIYYDTADNKFKVSQNGGSYVDLVGSGGTPEVTLNGVETLTNKRITNRVASQASSATPTPNSDTTDVYIVTALAADAVFAAPTGTPTDGQRLVIRLKDDGSPRALVYNGIYRPIGVTLPTVTTAGKTIYIEARFNTLDTKWDVILAAVEA